MTTALGMIEYNLLRASESNEMSQFLGEVFAKRDPPAVAAGITSAEFEAFVSLFCPKAVAECLSITARNAETGEMVGAVLAEDAGTEPPDTLNQVSSTFDPVFDILGQLDSEYRNSTAIRPGEYVHVFLVGVAEGFGGMGIAQELVTKCLENAVQNGFSRAVVECTNKTSQHVFRKLGFTDRVSRCYADHRYNGHEYFTSIADQVGPILMDKSLIS